MLNTLPADRALWTEHNTRKRDEYYVRELASCLSLYDCRHPLTTGQQDLARRLLTRLKDMPAPASPLSNEDTALLSISRALPGLLPAPLSHPIVSSLNPLDASAPDDTRITCADEVDRRAWMIANRHITSRPQPPAIQVNGDNTDVPQISLTAPPSSASEASPSTPLLRLMYIYTCLHPSTPPNQLPNILIPLYTTLSETTEEGDLVHVEADSFWLLEEVSAEFGDLWTDEGCDRWRDAIAKRLSWVDPDLSVALVSLQLAPRTYHGPNACHRICMVSIRLFHITLCRSQPLSYLRFELTKILQPLAHANPCKHVQHACCPTSLGLALYLPYDASRGDAQDRVPRRHLHKHVGQATHPHSQVRLHTSRAKPLF